MTSLISLLLAFCDGQVRSLVGDELFGRYDRLLLQNTLDSMPGVFLLTV